VSDYANNMWARTKAAERAKNTAAAHAALIQKHRDEVYEKCIRKAEQQRDMLNRAANFGQSRVLDNLIQSIKSMRHSEHT
jgi:hypothetical protein